MAGGRTRMDHHVRPRRHRPTQHRPSADRNLLAAVVESSEDAIVTKDLQGIVTSWNQGAERIFGYTREEMVGKSIVRLFPPDRIDEEQGILQRIRRGERVEHFETKRVRKDGTTIDVSVTISPLRDGSGRLVGASKIARDITERLLAERERALLAAIVASSSDAIVATDLDGTVTSWNHGAERLYGYTAEEIVGKPMAMLFPPERRSEAEEALEAVRRAGTIFRDRTQRMRKDGTRVDVAVTVSPLRAGDGTLFGISGIAQDITESQRRQTAERESTEAQMRALREMEEFRSRFINSAAHELANPLTPMAIQFRLLRRRAADAETLRSIGILERNFRRVERGIRDLLDAARIQANRLTVARRPVPLRTLLQEAVESFGPAAEASGVTLRMGPAPGLTLEGDEGRLMQVLYNFLSNAVKFTPSGGTVVLEAHARREAVRICVHDTGLGMEQDQLERLFRPYRQVHDPKLSPGIGMGLGLYISRALVEAHGGRIWAASKGLGKGTTVCIELPLPTGPAAQP
jgi:PAS domain S-box-containing protein